MAYRLVLVCSLALGTLVSAAGHEMIALTDDGALVVFRPGETTGRRVVPTGVSGRLAGIDRRPADGKLYGVTATDVYTLDVASGAATLVSTLTVPLDRKSTRLNSSH